MPSNPTMEGETEIDCFELSQFGHDCVACSFSALYEMEDDSDDDEDSDDDDE